MSFETRLTETLTEETSPSVALLKATFSLISKLSLGCRLHIYIYIYITFWFASLMNSELLVWKSPLRKVLAAVRLDLRIGTGIEIKCPVKE